ncbi:MAG: glycosyltransferase family 2 protein [Lachnospiraceae bacterium]|nr:glycosyltransferase family 2 protein [Lachnospiraceae bacterium]
MKSLIDQGRRDIEIIVVNDGSVDNTADIVSNFVNRDSCVVYLCQKNGGVSRARNNGLDHATGEYVLFVDSDDFVSKDYFEKLDQMNDETDICYFQNHVIGENNSSENSQFDNINQCSNWGDKMNILLASRAIMHPTNKRFKRRIIEENRIRFIEELNISEDFNFCLLYSMYCNDVQAYNFEIYHVDVSGEDSLSRKTRKNLTADIQKGFQCAETTLENAARTDKEKQQLLTTLDYLYIKNVCTCIAETFKYIKPSYQRQKNQYREICRAFRHRMGDSNVYCGFVHHIMRILVKMDIVFPFYVITKMTKERKYKKYRGMTQ